MDLMNYNGSTSTSSSQEQPESDQQWSFQPSKEGVKKPSFSKQSQTGKSKAAKGRSEGKENGVIHFACIKHSQYTMSDIPAS